MRPRVVSLALAGAVWTMAWVWLLAFSFSDSYFKYNQCSRVPVFAAALLGALALPAGAVLVWRRMRSVLGLAIGQAAVAGVSLVPLMATSFTLSRLPGRCHLSGDDAMGAGIDFLLLAATAVASIGVLALAGARRAATRRPEAPRDITT